MRRTVSALRRSIRAAVHTHLDLGRLFTAVGMVRARVFLTGVGVPQELADRFGSAFGRAAAKAYRTVTGRDPRRTWSVVNGRVREVNGFLPGEQHILAATLATYRPRDKTAAQAFANLTTTRYATAA